MPEDKKKAYIQICDNCRKEPANRKFQFGWELGNVCDGRFANDFILIVNGDNSADATLCKKCYHEMLDLLNQWSKFKRKGYSLGTITMEPPGETHLVTFPVRPVHFNTGKEIE